MYLGVENAVFGVIAVCDDFDVVVVVDVNINVVVNVVVFTILVIAIRVVTVVAAVDTIIEAVYVGVVVVVVVTAVVTTGTRFIEKILQSHLQLAFNNFWWSFKMSLDNIELSFASALKWSTTKFIKTLIREPGPLKSIPG